MIACCSGRDVGDCITALANIDGAFEDQSYRTASIESTDRPQPGRSIVVSSNAAAAIICRWSQTCRKKVSQRNVGRLGRTVVCDLNLESHRISFGRSRITTCQCLDRDQIRGIVDNN